MRWLRRLKERRRFERRLRRWAKRTTDFGQPTSDFDYPTSYHYQPGDPEPNPHTKLGTSCHCWAVNPRWRGSRLGFSRPENHEPWCPVSQIGKHTYYVPDIVKYILRDNCPGYCGAKDPVHSDTNLYRTPGRFMPGCKTGCRTDSHGTWHVEGCPNIPRRW